MDPLAPPVNFHSLSLRDLLDARDTYHWHLMNKANVVGTAVGAYLIRDDNSPEGRKAPRTLANSGVKDISWPCVLVLVRDWVAASGFGGAGGEYLAELRAGRFARAVCGMGLVSHYVGDACQPLHGSVLSDGYRDRPAPGGKGWAGRGVHSTFEDRMVDRFSAPLLAGIGPAARAGAGGAVLPIRNGRDAAFAVLTVMDFSARTLPPSELCDRYIALGGGTSGRVLQGLWDSFGERTATLMGAGANTLAAVWDAMAAAAGVALPGAQAFTEAELAAVYQDPAFVPSRTLDEIGPLLSMPGAAAEARTKRPVRPAAGRKSGTARLPT